MTLCDKSSKCDFFNLSVKLKNLENSLADIKSCYRNQCEDNGLRHKHEILMFNSLELEKQLNSCQE